MTQEQILVAAQSLRSHFLQFMDSQEELDRGLSIRPIIKSYYDPDENSRERVYVIWVTILNGDYDRTPFNDTTEHAGAKIFITRKYNVN